MTHVFHVKCARLETLAVTRRTRRHDIRQEAHFMRDNALTVARFTLTAAFRIERKTRWCKAQDFGFRRRCIQFANQIPNSQKRGRNGTWRATNRRLIDSDSALQRFETGERCMFTSSIRNQAELLTQRRQE